MIETMKPLSAIIFSIFIFFSSFSLSQALAAGPADQAKIEELSQKISEITLAISFLQEQIKELIGSSSPLQILDKELILEKIEQGKEFLFRMENQDEHGFYKRYDAINDSFESRLHTVYSASIIYTFLYINDLKEDEEILERLSGWGNFLLSMQNKDEEDKRYGAFSYSFYLDRREKEKKFVVGTSALSIFTLLRLYEITGDEKYLESAKLAGNWLITMQKPDGVIKPYTRYSEEDEKWVSGVKESLLYNGQVLSSLSKLYNATNDQRYYDTAEKIANRFAEKYEKAQGYVVGEYRTKNPISNSWVVMSLLDFYHINESERYKKVVYELSDLILKNQIKDKNDLINYGRWKGAYSTSGIGWIGEVIAEMYLFCKEEVRQDCNKYKDAVTRAIWWLTQRTYSEDNSFFLENPEMAEGGVFWSNYSKYVRTDSVCHALNGYTLIINDLKEGPLLPIP